MMNPKKQKPAPPARVSPYFSSFLYESLCPPLLRAKRSSPYFAFFHSQKVHHNALFAKKTLSTCIIMHFLTLLSLPNQKNGGGGGSRTPVRKALRHEDYMLSSVQVCGQPLRAYRPFAFRAQNEQEMRPASPIGLAWRSGPKRFGQPAV
jgi:hypothetical protein